jgi:transcriptional regulator with XRE-family HTH domain
VTINDVVSRNIRRFRIERQMSLGELAQRSGVSKQTLSKVEAGGGNPTVDTLESIGNALGVGIRRLVTEWGTRSRLDRDSGEAWTDGPTGRSRHLEQIYGSGYVRTQVVVVDANSGWCALEPHESGTLHQLYVIEGQLEAGAEGELTTLGPGDFLRFPGDVAHFYHSLSEHTLAHLTTTSPQVPQLSPEAGKGAIWPS